MPPAVAAALLPTTHGTAARPLPRWAGVRCTGPSPAAARPSSTAGGEAAGSPALLLAAGAAAGLLSHSGRRRRAIGLRAGTRGAGRRARWALPPTADQGLSDNYVPVGVTRPEGGLLEIDVRLTDTVKVLKAMVAMELGVAEDQQDLSFDGQAIEEGIMLGQLGIREGSKLQLAVRELDEEEAEALALKEGQVGLRVFIKCDAGAGGREKRIPLEVMPSDVAGDVKKRAFQELAKILEAYAGANPREFGLYILQSPPTDAKGQLRYLKREERLREKMTMKENGIKGGEEILFANLFWSE